MNGDITIEKEGKIYRGTWNVTGGKTKIITVNSR
jgi:hypothetical protein